MCVFFGKVPGHFTSFYHVASFRKLSVKMKELGFMSFMTVFLSSVATPPTRRLLHLVQGCFHLFSISFGSYTLPKL